MNEIDLHLAFESFIKERIKKDDLTKYITYDESTDVFTFDMRLNYIIDGYTLIKLKKV